MPVTQTAWERIVDKAMQVCVNTFGDGVDENGIGRIQIIHVGGQAYDVDGIFEAQSEIVDPDSGAKVISNQPQVSFKLSVLEQMPDMDDQILIRGYWYRVVEPMFDGQGTVTLRLHLL